MNINLDTTDDDASVARAMVTFEQEWRAEFERALSATTPASESLTILSFLARDMSNHARSRHQSSGPWHDIGWNIDSMLCRIFMESPGRWKACRSSISRHEDFLTCVFKYCLFRMADLLEQTREGTRLSSVCWASLDQLMTHAIETSRVMNLVTCGSPLDLLYLSPGFLTALEMMLRRSVVTSLRLTQQQQQRGQCRRWSNVVLQIGGALSCSTGIIMWKITHPRQCTHTVKETAEEEAVSCRACLSLLGTTLKFQRFLQEMLKDRKLVSGKLIAMLRDGMSNLMEIDSVGWEFRETDATVELFVTQALVAAHGLLRLVGLPGAAGLSASKKGRWEARIEQLQLQARQDLRQQEATDHVEHFGCHHPRCRTLEGASEAMMRTSLCGRCRRVRYCSKDCQRHHLKVHYDKCISTDFSDNV